MAESGDNGGITDASIPTFDFAAVLAIADALPMALAYVDTKLRYRFVNQALADFLERSRGEMLGQSMHAVLDAQVSERTKRNGVARHS